MPRIRTLLAIALAIVFVGAACSTTSTAGESTTATTTSATLPAVADYEVLDVEEVPLEGALGIRLRVLMPPAVTASQLRVVAEELAVQYRVSHQYQALSVGFVDYREFDDGFHSLGVWEDAPFGEWDRAAEAEPGDYSTFQSASGLRNKDWSMRPTQEHVDVLELWSTTWEATFAETDDFGESDTAADERARTEFQLTQEELLEILAAVTFWAAS
jgi:hypothetical protein